MNEEEDLLREIFDLKAERLEIARKSGFSPFDIKGFQVDAAQARLDLVRYLNQKRKEG